MVLLILLHEKYPQSVNTILTKTHSESCVPTPTLHGSTPPKTPPQTPPPQPPTPPSRTTQNIHGRDYIRNKSL